jgi:hypothetical protein
METYFSLHDFWAVPARPSRLVYEEKGMFVRLFQRISEPTKQLTYYVKWALFTFSILNFNWIWAADGLSGQVRGYRTGCLWAAVAPRVASSPHGSCRRYPCGHASSIPAAGVVE